jgi:hypothetical protein
VAETKKVTGLPVQKIIGDSILLAESILRARDNPVIGPPEA